MAALNIEEVKGYVAEHIGDFHNARLGRLSDLSLKNVLKKKNPYLYKAKNVLTAADFVETNVDAFLSSQEETIFGNFLEGLAIFVCEKVYGGRKSTSEGIDLEFDKDGVRYIVAIKSGPNWGNSSQIAKMKDKFNQATRIFNTSRTAQKIIPVNGCCYGTSVEDQDGYLKLCGQNFWSFISGNENLYIEIIEPLGYQAKERNEEFAKEYARVLNKFTQEFAEEYCNDGIIDWGKILRFNSSKNTKPEPIGEQIVPEE